MQTPIEEAIFQRILKICAGNPGAIVIFGNVTRSFDAETLESVLSFVEKMEWGASEVWDMFKDCDKDYDEFVRRAQLQLLLLET